MGKLKYLQDVLVKRDGKWVYYYEDSAPYEDSAQKGKTKCPTCLASYETITLADPECVRCGGEGYVCYECWWAKQDCTCPEETFKLSRKGCGF